MEKEILDLLVSAHIDVTYPLTFDRIKDILTKEECNCDNNTNIHMTTTILCNNCHKEVKTIRIR